MLLIAYSLLLLIFLALSWLAFYFSSQDASLIYQPLKSFLLAIKLGADSEFYSYPAWFLTSNNLKPPLLMKIFHELSMWFLAICSSFIYYKFLSVSQWFVLKKIPNFNLSVSRLIEFFKKLPQLVREVFKKKKPKPNLWLTKSIFYLSFNQITFWALFISGIAVFLLPQDSSDLFAYIARGAQQANYHMNPFLSAISQIAHWQNDQLLVNCLWENNPSSYGPLFMLICFLLVKLSFGNLWLALFLFKLMNWIVFALLLSLLCKILCDDQITELLFEDKFSSFEEQLAFKKVIYALVALNPLLIYECIWNAHNDLLMAFGILAIVYFAFKQKLNLSVFILILCFLFKYISLVLLPFVIIYAYKSKKIPLLGLSFGAALTYFFVSFYSLNKMELAKFSTNISLSHKSFYDLLNSLNKYISGEDLPHAFKYLFLFSFIIFCIWIFYKFWKTTDEHGLFYYSFLVLFVLIMIASPKFNSWYFVMLVPLGALVHTRLIVLLSFTHLLSFTFLDQANLINYLLMTAVPSLIYIKYLLRQDT